MVTALPAVREWVRQRGRWSAPSAGEGPDTDPPISVRGDCDNRTPAPMSSAMAERTPTPDDDVENISDLRPRTFWEKHGFKVILAVFALAVFTVGLVFG